MILNLILGAVAGYLSPMADPHIRKTLDPLIPGGLPVDRSAYDMFSLLVVLLAAGLLMWLMRVDSMAVPLVIGAMAGLFGNDFYKAMTTKEVRPAPRDDDNGPEGGA